VFNGRESLYKKEEKERPVIFMNWMRISIAAALIGLVAITWFFSQNNNSNQGLKLLTSTNNTLKRTPAEVQKIAPIAANKTVLAIPEKVPVKVESVATAKVKTKKAGTTNSGTPLMAAETSKDKPAQVKQPAEMVDENENQVPYSRSFEETIASAKITDNRNPSVKKEDADKVKFTAISSVDQSSSLATHAVYREIDNQENDEENTLYIGSAEINKTKLKDFFKKATHLFERKNSNNDGERTLKIAGFEIKSK
jgi:hypothetical protein